jgi:hypothetical protein
MEIKFFFFLKEPGRVFQNILVICRPGGSQKKQTREPPPTHTHGFGLVLKCEIHKSFSFLLASIPFLATRLYHHVKQTLLLFMGVLHNALS